MKAKSFLLIASIFLLVLANAEAQESNERQNLLHKIFLVRHKSKSPDLIDEKLKECEKKEFSTLGIKSCLNAAINDYEDLMKQAYEEALRDNDEETQKAIILSQEKWNDFKDAENHAVFKFPLQGSIAGIVSMEHYMAIVRQRIEDLSYYLQDKAG